MKRLFVHLPDFDSFWKKAKLDDLDLLEFQTHLLENPKSGVVIKETNGIRKIRWKKKGSGKSSGIRVFYLDVEEFEILFLITLLEKNDKENLSKAQLKVLGQLTLVLKDSLKKGRRKS
ncbi:hypothetical protein CH372_17325 [Leptospira meyeri]|uniref:hypothetical protein n=1 Tax=Leptospira meyeri TaxID=29508 RepID=UPI000C2AEA85|nr:hypothetical protein [Leptospira meyeri]PKA23964.1 hypothetical protein CH381_23185 [Leptospira sp. mixed culture ATI2-C-A1]MCW7491000.1 hypothetical protein [Leptospira meyeri]PKA10844.1 hypothetical protein CH372_17325 [Leptospira meyeri]TGM62936.1 hypothetical protein EHQ94_19795 [Leptospira meyeri]TGM68307.1 hypothetical protein EHQ93_00285 [Leptospira meyeri]